MGVSRRLPNSNPTRLYALNSAKAKLDADPATTVLTPATKARLTAIHTPYNQKTTGRNVATAVFAQSTDDKNTSLDLAVLKIGNADLHSRMSLEVTTPAKAEIKSMNIKNTFFWL